MMNANEKLQWEMQCYGVSEATLRNTIEQLEDDQDKMMLVASILSDAQELISGEFGEPNTERARQFMNRAKFILFNSMRETA